MTAIKSLDGQQTDTTGFGPLQLGSGDSVSAQLALNFTPNRLDIREGSAGSPTSNLAPTVKVSRTETITQAQIDAYASGADGAAAVAAIAGTSVGSSATETQAVGLFGGALNSSSSANNPDACGVYGTGRITGGSAPAGIAGGFGGFFQGRRDVDTAYATGVEISCANYTATAGVYGSANSDTKGIWINAIGNADSAVAIQVGNAFNHKFDVGLSFGSGNGGAITTWSIRDDSSSAVSLSIAGSHASGAIVINNNAGLLNLNNNFMTLSERTAPSAPGADACRIWVQDNGSNLTQLMCQFNTGGPKQIAIQS